MVSDQNKNITSISYNHLNLPLKIIFGSGNKIEYLYDAVGQKLSKKVTEGTNETVTDYLDGFQYTNTVLDFFPHAEGYVKVTYCPTCASEFQWKFNYVYQYKDHLGNIRLSYGYDEKDEVVKIIEENHYYPYGLKHSHYNSGEKKYDPDEDEPGKMKLKEVPSGDPGMNNYRFNGKEWQDELGLNMYAMDMRQYDPAIGRWAVQDPIVHVSQSPYNGFDGNPVMFADPSGGNVFGSNDYLGREKYDQFGTFIPMQDRGEGDENYMGESFQQQLAQSEFSEVGSGKTLSEDSFGTWIRYANYEITKTNEEVGGDTALEGFEMTPVYSYEFQPESENSIRETANFLEGVGTRIEIAGILSAVPSDGVGAMLIPIGEYSTAIGTLMNAGRDYYLGDRVSAYKRVALWAATAGLGVGIKKTTASRPIDEKILKTLLLIWETGMENWRENDGEDDTMIKIY